MLVNAETRLAKQVERPSVSPAISRSRIGDKMLHAPSKLPHTDSYSFKKGEDVSKQARKKTDF